MKFITEYRDANRISVFAAKISEIAGSRKIKLMEVCGTHTMAVARFGLRSLLPQSISLISGPGCPVCVTPNDYLDHAMAITKIPNVITCTFGDLMRVPGSYSSLEKERARGCDIRAVYSTLDALDIARREKNKNIVFLGVGFETTAPTIAASIKSAHEEGITNFTVLSACRTIPSALDVLLSRQMPLSPSPFPLPSRERVADATQQTAWHHHIDGMILPGHVSSIIGVNAYREILSCHHVSGVVAGFEPTDIMDAILTLISQIVSKKPALNNAYTRAVTDEGNSKALVLMNEVFEPCDAKWRGLGFIPNTGLCIRKEFCEHDAAVRFKVEIPASKEPAGCICGKILTGQALPRECPLFKKTCTPEHPIGACMVSSEGTCAAAAKYNTE